MVQVTTSNSNDVKSFIRDSIRVKKVSVVTDLYGSSCGLPKVNKYEQDTDMRIVQACV